MKWKRGLAAMFLSILLPGLGQLYNRQVRKAVSCLAILPLLIVAIALIGLFHTFSGLMLGLIVSVSFQIGVAVEAGVVGFRQQQISSLRRSRLAVVGFVILALIHISLQVGGVYTRQLLRLRGFVIRSNSMAPTLRVGDRAVADTSAYLHAAPKRGDLVVFAPPGEKRGLYTKRVAAVPGDLIEVAPNGVDVNGKRDTRFVAATAVSDIFGPQNVPENSVFVLGDDLNDSFDSRYFGTVPLDSIRGELLYIYWSPEHSRIGMKLR